MVIWWKQGLLRIDSSEGGGGNRYVQQMYIAEGGNEISWGITSIPTAVG